MIGGIQRRVGLSPEQINALGIIQEIRRRNGISIYNSVLQSITRDPPVPNNPFIGYETLAQDFANTGIPLSEREYLLTMSYQGDWIDRLLFPGTNLNNEYPEGLPHITQQAYIQFLKNVRSRGQV